MTCDSNRPCARCVKRNIGHLCHDEVKDKHRENGTESTSQSPAVEPTSPEQMSHIDAEIKTGNDFCIHGAKVDRRSSSKYIESIESTEISSESNTTPASTYLK